jgi:hypothetical protein
MQTLLATSTCYICEKLLEFACLLYGRMRRACARWSKENDNPIAAVVAATKARKDALAAADEEVGPPAYRILQSIDYVLRKFQAPTSNIVLKIHASLLLPEELILRKQRSSLDLRAVL